MDYTGMACRGKEEDERTGDVRKGGVSYPPNLADAKEDTPNERKRMQKRKHRMKENAALKYRERDEEIAGKQTKRHRNAG